MKFNRLLCALTVIAAAQLARADLPFSGQSLGNLQATMDFCTRVQPEEAAKFQDQFKMFIKGFPEKELAALLQSDEYKATYETTGTALDKLAKPQANETCKRLLHN
jgi:hypothetical protein